MKTKIDFVTNSSCASFVILKEKLTELQIYIIKNHTKIVNEYSGKGKHKLSNSGWLIKETKKIVSGKTSMDNFNMLAFLLQMGVNEDDIEYKGCYE